MPVSATVCVEPAALPALSVTVRIAPRLPGAPGVKVTEMVQLDPAVTEPAQLFVGAKSVELVPLIAILAIVNVAEPELLSVVVKAAVATPTVWLPKTRVEGDTAAAATPTPVPVRLTVCVEPAVLFALSVTVRVAVRLPLAVGEKVTAILQLEAAATLPAQLFVVEKLLAFVPLRAMLAIVRAAEPALLSVIVCAALDVPTF